MMVDVGYVGTFTAPITLATLKQTPGDSKRCWSFNVAAVSRCSQSPRGMDVVMRLEELGDLEVALARGPGASPQKRLCILLGAPRSSVASGAGLEPGVPRHKGTGTASSDFCLSVLLQSSLFPLGEGQGEWLCLMPFGALHPLPSPERRGRLDQTCDFPEVP